MKVTKMVDQKQFVDFVTNSGVVRQPNWKNMFDSPLNAAVLASVFNSTKSAQYVDDALEDAEEMIPANDGIAEFDDKNIGTIDEQNAFFDNSVSVFEKPSAGDGDGDENDDVISFQCSTLSISLGSTSNASGRTVTLKRLDRDVTSIEFKKPQETVAKPQYMAANIPQEYPVLKFRSASSTSGQSGYLNRPKKIDPFSSKDAKPSRFKPGSSNNTCKIIDQSKAVDSGGGAQRAKINRKQLPQGHGWNQRRNPNKNKEKSDARQNNGLKKNQPHDEFKNHDRTANDAVQNNGETERKNPFRRAGTTKPSSKPTE